MVEVIAKIAEVAGKGAEKLAEAAGEVKAKVANLDRPLNINIEKSFDGLKTKESHLKDLDKPLNNDILSKNEGTSMPRSPENNGNWDGERGNSIWHPDKDYRPPEKSKNPDKPYSNPDDKTMGELMDKYGINGIAFKDGFPDFKPISKGDVQIEGFKTGGQDAKENNFKQADVALAKQRGCEPKEVEKWRKENNYTWHECEDKMTMQKVPNEIHANISHDGGRSQV